jgi:hypothetical protein
MGLEHREYNTGNTTNYSFCCIHRGSQTQNKRLNGLTRTQHLNILLHS